MILEAAGFKEERGIGYLQLGREREGERARNRGREGERERAFIER